MAYIKTEEVIAGITDATAAQYNDLRAEVKAAAEGLQIADDIDLVIAYTNGLPTTVTATDNQGSLTTDIDYVQTVTYANGLPTTVATVFGKLVTTLTEIVTYTNGLPTGIARTTT
jgi:hypothetical protein